MKAVDSLLPTTSFKTIEDARKHLPKGVQKIKTGRLPDKTIYFEEYIYNGNVFWIELKRNFKNLDRKKENAVDSYQFTTEYGKDWDMP